MSAEVVVRKVESPADFKTLVEFPWKIYKDDPNWVPPLLSVRRHLLDRTKNVSWEYLQGEIFIAWRGTEAVGTIAAFVNPRHNDVWDEQIGFFGCFETINDQTVATALLQAAADHLRSMGPYTAMRGPATFTCNDEGWGLLIENFSRPSVQVAYNPPYYQTLIDGANLGLVKVMDLLSYYLDEEAILRENGQMPSKITRIVNKAMERHQITVRKPEIKNLRQELASLREIYVSGWEKNWGNVPPTDKEMDQLFNDLKDYVDPELGLFVYVRGQLAGFFLALPDMNEVLQRAYPRPEEPEIFTLVKALWHWKLAPKITWQRCLLAGVKPEFRKLGVDAVCFLKYFEHTINGKYKKIDASWVLETNDAISLLAKEFNAKVYKRHRMYQTNL
jgi:hypothetical protein